MSNFLNIPTFKAPTSSGTKQQNEPTSSATGNPRNKTALKPGRSLMDWVRLGSSGKDLAGTGGRTIGITSTELKKHNKEDDAWICVRGKVFNVTPYMEFHPGGIPELMRGVGMDATQLFDEVHNWVNYESMLAKCYLGPLVSDGGMRRQKSPNKLSLTNTAMPPPLSIPPIKSSSKTPPRFEWFQTDTFVNLVFYPRWKQMNPEYVVIEKLEEKKLKVILQIEDYTYAIVLNLGGAVKPDYDVSVSKLTGKVAIDLQKEIPEQRWTVVKEDESEPNTFVKTSEVPVTYRKCTVISVENVSHDTKLYCVALPEGTRMCVPVGHHVQIQETVLGMQISRNYTVVDESLDQINSLQNQGKRLYLMIKIYSDGALTPIIGLLKPGESLHVSTVSQGTFDCSILDNVECVIMFAAGTGFTPMVRLIHYALICGLKPQRKVTLVFFNKETKDILWKDQLNTLQSKYTNFDVQYVLSQPRSDWSGLKGRIKRELISQLVPKPIQGRNFYFCSCGPTPFTEECVKLVKEHGYTDQMIHAFLG